MVSIIILSYNTKDLLKQCLTALFEHISAKEVEVIVVDNASTDETVAMLSKAFRQVKVIANDTNAGFSKGCNIGASHAKGDYLLFLNSDTLLSQNPLHAMIEVFNNHEKVGAVGGLFKNADGSLQRSFGAFYSLRHVAVLLFEGEQGELGKFHPDTTKQVDWVSGGFMLVASAVFKQVHGYNEAYFMYIEDMDLCFRIKKAGYDVWFTPDAIVNHVGHGSSNRAFAITQIYKGLQIFYKQQQSTLQYYLLKCLLAAKALSALTVGALTANKQLVSTYTKALRTL